MIEKKNLPLFTGSSRFRQILSRFRLMANDSIKAPPVCKSRDEEYRKYIQSEAWQRKREEVIRRDGGKCVLCDSTECLEVHHRNYDRLGNEDLADLTTLCRECHEIVTDMLRRRRYEKKGWQDIPDFSGTSLPGKAEGESPYGWTPVNEGKIEPLPRPIEREEANDNVVQNFDLPDSRPLSYPSPQRANGRSAERLYQKDQENFRKTEQD